MRPPLARLSRAGLAVFAAACLLLSIAPSPAQATHWLVDQNGGGDFTTIQEALDAVEAGLGWRESTLVLPGCYAESLVVSTSGASYILVAAGSPGATTVNSISYSPGASWPDFIENFTFTQQVTLTYDAGHALFKRCVFASSYWGGSPMFEDCDFYGRAAFLGVENHGWSRSLSVAALPRRPGSSQHLQRGRALGELLVRGACGHSDVCGMGGLG